jgi:hypothetical protein
VSETYSSSTTKGCNGNAGDTVCLWMKLAYTAYTVQTQDINSCGDSGDLSDPIVIKSPNDNNLGGNPYCVVGACRNQGDSYWDNTGPAGGPQ